MVVVGSAVFPHGCMILDPSREGLPKRATEIHNAGLICANEIQNLKPDIIVLSTPHGVTLSKSLGIYFNSIASGNAEWNGEWSDYTVKLSIADNIARKLHAHINSEDLSAEGINAFSKTEFPLRWGEVVPLWFLAQKCPKSKFIIITAPVFQTSTDREERTKFAKARSVNNLKYGSSMQKFFDNLTERVVFVVSGDLSHVHPSDCPDPLYMPNPLWTLPTSKDYSALYDSLIEKWVKTQDPSILLDEAMNAEGGALSCGLDGFVMLQGLLSAQKTKFQSQVLINAAPTYYGMMVALWK